VKTALRPPRRNARVLGRHGAQLLWIPKTYGYRDTVKGLPLTANSVMTSASLTEAAFATVVTRLVEERAIDLDNPVFEYLPTPR
jgi:CubicO group peptidase (beta-lactamase class C family)